MSKHEITITEIEEFEPSRVDGVGKGANGFPVLMLKSIGEENDNVASVTKADDRADCKTCKGEGKIMGGNRKCPDCFGSGKAPKVGESMKQFMEAVSKDVPGSAPSGSGETPAKFCPTCHGDGFMGNSVGEGADARKVGQATDVCPDCGGTGLDEARTNPAELRAVDAFAGEVSMGDPQGRERIDKADGESCPECAKAMKEGLDRCPLCGEKVEVEKGHGDVDVAGFRPTEYKADADEIVGCPKCERMNAPDAAFCDQCGHQLIGDHHVTVNGVELEDAEDAEKAMDPSVGGGVDREKIDAKDFAGKNRSFPIVTPKDVADAASSLGRAGADNYSTDKIKANIIKIAKRKGAEFIAKLPQKWQDEMAEKAITVSLDGLAVSGSNPMDAAPEMPMHDLDNDPDGDLPGGPAWEAVDAATATAAAQALMQAAELIRTFAQREAIEVAAGEGNDIYDTNAAQAALCGVSEALGIMAALAFHEGLEAQKSIEDEDDVAKAGKRLSTKSVAALAAARDHLTSLLGSDDPAKEKDGEDDGSDAVSKYLQGVDEAQLSKEIENMTTDELAKVLDARDERLVSLLADTLKDAKKAKKDKMTKKSDDEKVAEDLDDAEDAIEDAKDDQEEDMENEEGEDMDAEKSVDESLTPEEIEAKQAAKEAKKALKAARKAEKEAAENAAVQKAIAEGVAEATEAVRVLQERLATVEKMAAPSTIVRTRTNEELTKSVERDELELRLAHAERVSRETSDNDIRKAMREEANEIRNRIAGLSD